MGRGLVMVQKYAYDLTQQSGFTLIELSIAITIIGVLTAVAILQYQVYLGKAQAGRVINELGQLRLNVEECLQMGMTTVGSGSTECNPHAPASNLLVGSSQTGETLPVGTGVAQVTSPLTISTNITGILSTKAMPALSGTKVIWSRTNDGSWRCISNIEAKYLPEYCQRNENI